jgi:hypothetical protein
MARDSMPASGPDTPVPVPVREPTPTDGQGATGGGQGGSRGTGQLPPSGGAR